MQIDKTVRQMADGASQGFVFCNISDSVVVQMGAFFTVPDFSALGISLWFVVGLFAEEPAGRTRQ